MKSHMSLVLIAALAALACTAAAGTAGAPQGTQAPGMEYNPATPPLGRPQPQPPMMPQAKPAPGMEGCPMCQMSAPGDKARMMEMHMRQAGVPEETITRAQMLMRAQISAADPHGLLALKDQLGLTPEQVDTLKQVIDTAQERALGVLTPDQWAKVRQLPPQSVSMMEMHGTVMPIMMRAMRDRMRQGPGGGMTPMAPEQQTPYGRPQPGDQEAPGCPMKPGCK